MNLNISERDQPLRWIIGAIMFVTALVLFVIDPENGGFPSCPFHFLTGLLCPGCGSQRALHDLLHLRIGQAFDHNALLVASIPILVVQWCMGRWGTLIKMPSGYNSVVFAWLVIILAWSILRNCM